MKKIILIILILSCITTVSAQKFTDKYIKEASLNSEKWWSLVNNGEFEESYEMLTDLLKDRYSINSWKMQISMLMDEIGQIKSRSIEESYFQSELEGFENGFYVIINYQVDYTKTKNHTENIILKQNNNFKWNVFDFNYTFQSLE